MGTKCPEKERICLYCDHWKNYIVSSIFNDFGKCAIDKIDHSMYYSCRQWKEKEFEKDLS